MKIFFLLLILMLFVSSNCVKFFTIFIKPNTNSVYESESNATIKSFAFLNTKDSSIFQKCNKSLY